VFRVSVQLEIETVFFAKLCVWLGDLCGFALGLTAKSTRDFAKSAKKTAPAVGPTDLFPDCLAVL
jgi:hypothetical protein